METIKKNKKTFIIGLLSIILFIGIIKENDNQKTEYCYKGVTYIQFGVGTRTFGSVMFDQNGSIVKCKGKSNE